ncbi:MAG: response regulator [Pseudomonadales bacterium]
MTSDNNSLSQDLLAHAPVGVILLNANLVIEKVNATAIEILGSVPGTNIMDLVHPDTATVFGQMLLDHKQPVELRLKVDLGSKVVEAMSLPPEDERQVLFVTDISEKVALGRQLRMSRYPSKKIMGQLRAANTTMLGYAELIAVLLDEEPVIAGDRLSVVKRYHKELRKSLDTVDRLLKQERLGGRRSDPTVPLNHRHVVIVDDEVAITEYIAELMRGMRYRVSPFSNASEAITFCLDNASDIDLVIADHRMPQFSGQELAAALHNVRAEIPVILCSEQDDTITSDSQTYHCEKPIDINDLTRMVSDLI